MRFKSPTHEPVTLNANGKVAIVTSAGTDVDDEFIEAAQSKGCVPEPASSPTTAQAPHRNPDAENLNRTAGTRYKSPTSKSVTVTSDDGKTTAVVGPEFAELADEFHDSAEDQGCVSEPNRLTAQQAADQQSPTRSPARATTKGRNQ